MNNAIEEIEKNDIGKIEKDVFLSKYTTYRVGGLAKYIVYPKNAEKLVTLIKILKKNNVMFKILGNGSNLLFSDKQFPGILIKLNEFNDVEFIGNKVFRKYSENIHLSLLYDGIANVKIYAIVVPIVP